MFMKKSEQDMRGEGGEGEERGRGERERSKDKGGGERERERERERYFKQSRCPVNAAKVHTVSSHAHPFSYKYLNNSKGGGGGGREKKREEKREERREKREERRYFKHSRLPDPTAVMHVFVSHPQPFSCAYLEKRISEGREREMVGKVERKR